MLSARYQSLTRAHQPNYLSANHKQLKSIQFRLIASILGLGLVAFSISTVPSIITAWMYAEPVRPWLRALIALLVPGAVLWYMTRSPGKVLKVRDGFLATSLVWICLCAAAALVLHITSGLNLSAVDAAFEATSGLTTTGATVLTGLDDMPRSVLLYRQLLQWVGGLGVLVLAIAILPALEVGGMQMQQTMSGNFAETMMPARLNRRARWLLILYLLLTGTCALAYWLAGMDTFDAIAHSFTTVAIGGFSTHDTSIGYFQSPIIESICILFMLLSVFNFALHFSALRHRHLGIYRQDAELRFFVRWLFLLLSVICLVVVLNQDPTQGMSLRQGIFQGVSFATTTGFHATDLSLWPMPLLLLLIASSCMGGCSGSMGGGIKAFRVRIVLQHARRETMRLVHPSAVTAIKVGRTPVSERALESLWAFLAIWLISFFVLFGSILATGMEPFTALSAILACMTNLGPGQGEVVAHYGEITTAAKWILATAMLLGRLEFFTLLVLFSPIFWRH